MSDDTLLGRQLANFRLDRVIGRGGMAAVYYGWDVKLERPVAVKVIDARYRGQATYAKRFVQEARAIATWRHENIIQVYYADDQDGLYYFVMEYVDGEDVAQLLEDYALTGELIPHPDVLRIGRAVANALDYAHRKGIIHRDVKPSNIIIASDGRVVLGDFGLALDVQQGSFGEVMGTPHYIAPEQASRSANAVPQSDLYSLGVILYEMLTGVVPFDDPSPATLALQHMTAPPPSPREINPDLNAETEAVLQKALSKSPTDRYQMGKELMDALEKALQATPPVLAASNDLPPLPAALPKPPRATRPLSRVSVSEKIALNLKDRSLTRTEAFFPTPPNSNRKKFIRLGGFALGVLIPIALLGFFLTQSGFLPMFKPTAVAAIPSATATTTDEPSPTKHPSATASATLTATVSRTPQPTQTATRVVRRTATATIILSSDETSLTLTAAMTLTPSETETPTPDATGAETATPTAAGTFDPNATPTATPGRKFVLYYNYNSFYLLNFSGKNTEVAPFAFQRFDTSGKLIKSFEGVEWSKYEPTLLSQTCMRIEIKNTSPYLRPPDCLNAYRSTRLPFRNSPFVFWTYLNGAAAEDEFRVLWNNVEWKRCKVEEGKCEVFLP